jgi:dipeptidyl aminopeptidase/acylaminoacyl peptidase
LSGNGEYSLSATDRGWSLNNIPAGNKKLIPVKCFGKPWFTEDGKMILFEGYDELWNYEIKSGKLTELATFKGYQITIENGNCEYINALNFNFSRQTVNSSGPLVIKLNGLQNNFTSYVLWHDGKTKVIVPSTSDNILYFTFNSDYNWFSWVEENFNKPPYLLLKETDRKDQVIYKSNVTDKAVLSLKQEIIIYTNSYGVPLTGILYYPLNYNSAFKYPMVVHIYQVQSRKVINEYPVVSYAKGNNEGFNLRLLLESGYFVFYPDIVYGKMGTGLSALDCVNRALDALQENQAIDKNRIGLIGHSHGGYETNFIATHSDRFATYVSGAGNSDIVRSYFSFNNCFQSPFYWQYENGQYKMAKSFCEDKDLYFNNNPIYYVDQVNAPVLLWTGMNDQNIYWEQTMEFYIGLKRNNKKVIALFYPEEAHALFNPEACKDLVSRVMDWFDYFLKGEKNIDWINFKKRGELLAPPNF